MFQNSFTSGSPAAEKAVKKLKNDSRFFASECVELVEKAADWGMGFAAGSDKNKREFLEEISQGKGKAFFQEVLDAYKHTAKPVDLRGRCGYEIGSSDYLTYFERSVFEQDLPSGSSVRWGSPSYTVLLRDALEHIFREVERDLDWSARENNYITDATAEVLRAAAKELERCGVGGILESKIEKLAWFVGGDPSKIRQLQSRLNTLGVSERLTEDGVYGRKTLEAWVAFVRRLEHGTVPTLAWIDPLQSSLTKLTFGATTKAKNLGISNAVLYNDTLRYMHFDSPHGGTTTINGVKKPLDFNHVNFEEMPNSNWLYNQIQGRYNHYPMSNDAYNVLKDLKATGKKVRTAGKILFAAGIALDTLELGVSVYDSYKSTGKYLGENVAATAISIGGSWAGAALGAKLGAVAGAATGPLAPVAIPVLSLVGGVGGSFAGDALAQWVVDITNVED